MKTTDKVTEELNDFFNQQYEGGSELDGVESFLARLEYAENGEIDQPSLADQWLKILKGAFLFLPGAFFLYMMSTFLFHAFFSGHFSLFQVIMTAPQFLIMAFMVVFGISDIRYPKNWLIPVAIVGFSFIAYLILGLTGDAHPGGFSNYSSAFMFPLVLAVSVFLRDLLKEE